MIDAGAAVLPEAEQDAEQDVPAADEEVHVIILFEQKSLAKKGLIKDLLENEKAVRSTEKTGPVRPVCRRWSGLQELIPLYR